VSYSAAIESAATLDTDSHPAEFTQRVLREATRRGFEQTPRPVVLGDGAAYIWNIAQELFPGALQIVDRYHVKEHLSDVAKAIYGPDNQQSQSWASKRHQELDEGRLQPLLRALESPRSSLRAGPQMCRLHQKESAAHALR
jgi:transposase